MGELINNGINNTNRFTLTRERHSKVLRIKKIKKKTIRSRLTMLILFANERDAIAMHVDMISVNNRFYTKVIQYIRSHVNIFIMYIALPGIIPLYSSFPG